jgi:hypothetical protein
MENARRCAKKREVLSPKRGDLGVRVPEISVRAGGLPGVATPRAATPAVGYRKKKLARARAKDS